jgi:nitrate reductase gamma subunit
VPFHYGILGVLAGHLVAFLSPRQILAWNSNPLRLLLLEVSALIFGLLTLVGFVAAILRRVTDVKVRHVTSRGDWLLYAMLLFQVVSGVAIALLYPWRLVHALVMPNPYLWRKPQVVRWYRRSPTAASLPSREAPR